MEISRRQPKVLASLLTVQKLVDVQQDAKRFWAYVGGRVDENSVDDKSGRMFRPTNNYFVPQSINFRRHKLRVIVTVTNY
jgi:hypothetical protein